MVIDGVRKIMEKYEADFHIEIEQKGPAPQWQGHNKAKYYLYRTKELASWINSWEVMDREDKWDKVIQGYSGPILQERQIKIQRMPFIVPEAVVSPAHQLPAEVLVAIDKWVWKRIQACKRVHITDPKGTDLRYTNHNTY